MTWMQFRVSGGARLAACCMPLLLAAACAGTAPDAPDSETPSAPAVADGAASAEPERNPLRSAYFGDFHVHTNWSLDAYVLGVTATAPPWRTASRAARRWPRPTAWCTACACRWTSWP